MNPDPQTLLAQADKQYAKSRPWKIYKWQSSVNQDTLREAADLFEQAGIAFIGHKQNQEAGKAYERCADAFIEAGDLASGGRINTLAVDQYKLLNNVHDTLRCLQKSADCFASAGNFSSAGKSILALGKILDIEVGDRKGAIKAYETGASWWEMVSFAKTAAEPRSRVAEMLSEDGDYGGAIQAYERLIDRAVKLDIHKMYLDRYITRAGICHLLSGDLVAMSRFLHASDHITEWSKNIYEKALLHSLGDAMEKGDIAVFTQTVTNYKLKKGIADTEWTGVMLERAIKNVKAKEDDFS